MYLDYALQNSYFNRVSEARDSDGIRCPLTGKQYDAVEEYRQITIGDENGVWWHCPACRGWHITFNQQETALVRALKTIQVF